MKSKWKRATKKGITFDEAKWVIDSTSEVEKFFSNLQLLVPEGSVLYIEGGAEDETIFDLLEPFQYSHPLPIKKETLWSSPPCFHCIINDDSMRVMRKIAGSNAVPDLLSYLCVYSGEKIILYWHDAFLNWEILLSEDIDEGAIRLFCSEMKLSYSEVKKNRISPPPSSEQPPSPG